MSRYIDADALMETIRTHDYPLRDYFNSTDRGMFTSGIKQAVDEQPTIDAVEAADKRIAELMPKEGEWEERYIEDANPMFRRRFYCSRCGDWTTHGKTRYCPNCGAEMKGEEK